MKHSAYYYIVRCKLQQRRNSLHVYTHMCMCSIRCSCSSYYIVKPSSHSYSNTYCTSQRTIHKHTVIASVQTRCANSWLKNEVLYCAFHPAFESLPTSVHPSPLLSFRRRLLPVQTNIADHDPQNCSQYIEQGSGAGLFNPATGEVNTTIITGGITNEEIICPAAKFTPAPATVSSSEISLLHSVHQALLCTYYVCTRSCLLRNSLIKPRG